jgi:hypothetical protein
MVGQLTVNYGSHVLSTSLFRERERVDIGVWCLMSQDIMYWLNMDGRSANC